MWICQDQVRDLVNVVKIHTMGYIFKSFMGSEITLCKFPKILFRDLRSSVEC